MNDIAYDEARNLTAGLAPPWEDLQSRLAILSKRMDGCQVVDSKFYHQMLQIPVSIDEINLDKQEDFIAATQAAQMMKRAVEIERATGNGFPVMVAKFAERRAKFAMIRRRELFFHNMVGWGGDQSVAAAAADTQRERERLQREAGELRDRVVSTYTASYETVLDPKASAKVRNFALERILRRAQRLSAAPVRPNSATTATSSPPSSSPQVVTPKPPASSAQGTEQLNGPVVKLSRRIKVSGASSSVTFSHDGDKFIVMSNPPDNDRQNVWLDCFSMETGRRLFRVYNGDTELNPMQAIFSPDDRVIYHQRRARNNHTDAGPCAISSTTGETIWWREQDRLFTGGLAVSPDGRYVVAGDWSDPSDCPGEAAVYYTVSGQVRARLRQVKRGYANFVFSPKGSFMAEQTGGGLRVVGTDDWVLRYASKEVTGVVGNCRDGLAGTIGWGPDCQLLIIDWATGRTLAKHQVFGFVTLSPSLKWYVKGDEETGLAIRVFPDDQLLQRLTLPGKVGFLGLSDDGRWLAIRQDDEVLILRTGDEYM